MKDEIKEILDELESMFEISELEEQINNINKIKNHITDLQEELKSANESITWWTNRFKAVEEENKRLKELDENYPIEEQLEEALKREKDYKLRNEKAIEYIKSSRWKIDTHIEFNKQHLLNILEREGK